jgi:hypothetical protein
MPILPFIATDITRMKHGNVCIAGLTKDLENIRPVFENRGIWEKWLFTNDQAVIRPFGYIELNFLRSHPKPPHSEDYIIRSDYKLLKTVLPNDIKMRILQAILDDDVSSIFGAVIQAHPGYYIKCGEGNRSLGTIIVNRINNISYRSDHDVFSYHIDFSDATHGHYILAVTDLAFHLFLDELRSEGLTSSQICVWMTNLLRQRQVFFRIGLTRPGWAFYPDCCFLQITAVYTFPDYLDGRCFADFPIALR